MHNIQDKKIQLAVSFSGDDRKYVEEVIGHIKKREPHLSVFYDRDYSETLVGVPLYDYLRDMYLKRSQYVMIFFSESYNTKQWPNVEASAIKDRLVTNLMDTSFLIPILLDSSPHFLPIQTGYWSRDTYSAERIAEMAVHKIHTGESVQLEFHKIFDILDLASMLKEAICKSFQLNNGNPVTDEGYQFEIPKTYCRLILELQYKNAGINALLIRYHHTNCKLNAKFINRAIFKLSCDALITMEEFGWFSIRDLDLLYQNYTHIEGTQVIEKVIDALHNLVEGSCTCYMDNGVKQCKSNPNY